MLHLPRFLPIEDEDCSSSLSCPQLRLKEQGIWTCGTIRSNRLRDCPLLSEQALKAVVYLRATQNTSETRVSFVAAKSKVAPLKKLGELALPVDVCYCWSDSSVALSCIRGDACRWKPFVANRVREIQGQYCIPGESRIEHLHPCRLSDMVARPILVTGDTSGLADVRRPKHIRKRG
ncbi:hypothetical protein T07_3540 [Trichinella nelsoni]|uniref:Uncharacterized protein n=1 Tax=Trichinella nelsoni TaxID=6336 RepID=A0A0V0S7W5_9BILA|nr:hypothetical protein T07_3540 [Trichinella nelsoni]